jgi:4-amino-4-deoxy-L-arabinose transferase-like glycosyltransferase
MYGPGAADQSGREPPSMECARLQTVAVSLSDHPGRLFAWLLLAALCLWGGEYFARDLWEPDEARFAYVAEEMRQGGHLLVPHRHGEYYAHKPPLMFWLMNAAGVLSGAGINAVTARLPSLLGGVASLWSVWMLMALWNRREEAPWAALLCATTYLFWKQGGWGQIDMLLCGLELLALYFLFAQDQTRSTRQALLAYLCMGLAILAKGPVGFLIPWGAYLAAKLAAGERSDLVRFHWVWGLLVTLAFPALWLLLVWASDPPEGYLRELLIAQNIERARGAFGGHQRPFYYFMQYMPLDGLPWILLAPSAWHALGKCPEDRALRLRLIGWAGFVVIFFSLSVSKRNLYILPVYPALALLVAAAWPRMREAHWPGRLLAWLAWPPIVLAAAAILWGALHPYFRGDLPLDGRLAPLAGVLILITAVFLHRWFGEPKRSGMSLFHVALLWLVTEAAIGAWVMPGFNDLKAPRAFGRMARAQLAPGEPLHLYQVNGEILALYAGAPGRRVADEEGVRAIISAHPHGLIATAQRKHGASNPLPVALFPHARLGEFQMGGKIVFWAEWSTPVEPAPCSVGIEIDPIVTLATPPVHAASNQHSSPEPTSTKAAQNVSQPED